MEVNKEPFIHIKGIRQKIEKDLEKHQVILNRSNGELVAYKKALSYELQKKKYYKSLLGGEKYNDDSLKESINGININIRHMTDKIKLTNDAIVHHRHIVNVLSKQLSDYDKNANLYELLKRDKNANSN